MLQRDTIKTLKNSSAFKLFSEWVLEEIQRIDSTSDLTKLSNAGAGEEAKIRAKTVNVLKKILTPVIVFKERKAPSTEKVQEAKDRAGI